MKRKRLLYVGNALSNKGKTVTTIETLSLLLRQEGYDVEVTSTISNKLLRMFGMMRALLRSRKSIDTVLIDTYSTSNFWFAVIIASLCRTYSIPYIPILHGGNLPERLINNKKTCKKLFTKAAVNVVPSGYLYNAFAKAGFSNITYIPNTIELEKYPFKERTVFQPNLLWVRSFAEIYNPLMAIQVLEKLYQQYPEATLTMVGPDKDGSLALCEAYVRKHNLPLHFTGRLSKEAWTSLAQDHDVFISTTNFDNTPVSVMEAMALGLPVVSTNVGGMPYLIQDTVDGLLSAPEDVAAFSEKLSELLENTASTKKIVLNARQKVETFDWIVVKEQWHKVLC
ncbi:glycosyl transferase family 1 [Dokdonia sp. Dokd-P16]|uniref:glycosyltransferase family 4 protein n=1 Tax=Dokdonia sp. Dokd-P16 TaxID=2173169 RepID=UPI000D547DA1|nr:glycosyltransferase family 4 protein [Dokdonia sp. Dokd-P16]AWH72861.1 glycosyl transferase family 1 [Dokdonia sp. Dokd-P16]